MLKKLRIKFIVLNMATVAIVLIVVFSIVCFLNYQQDVQKVYDSLEVAITRSAAQNNTQYYSDYFMPNNGLFMHFGSSENAENSNSSEDTDKSTHSFEIGGVSGGDYQSVPVAVFELETDGSLMALSYMTTATISDQVLNRITGDLFQVSEGKGMFSDVGLYYEKRILGDVTYVAFADMGSASSTRSLAIILALVGLAAFAVFFVISVFFSRWALKPVAHAWSLQRRFVADASHDLKTPLTVILADTAILLRHPQETVASQSQWVESMQNEAEYMQKMVEDMLLLARIDEGAAARQTEEVDMAELVMAELLEFESVAWERQVCIEQTITEDIKVQGDFTKLRRMVITLLDNACKYVDEGGSVSVALKRLGHTVQLSVHNTGAVILKEDLPHVFDRFYRSDKARSRDVGGHGLGLAIAYAIATEHGGTLNVTSAENQGTTFTATLPAA